MTRATFGRVRGCVGVLLLAAAAPATGQEREPDWGTGQSVVTIPAAAFAPLRGGQDYSIVDEGIRCNNPNSANCLLGASFQLPSGARIVGFQLEACDETAAGSARLVLTTCPLNQPCAAAAIIVTGVANMPGCVTFDTGTLAITVDNAAARYEVGLSIEDASNTLTVAAARIKYVLQVSPAPATARFTDVPTTHALHRFVEALAASGITGGCTANQFCPDAPLTRGQMAVFLSVALGLHFPN